MNIIQKIKNCLMEKMEKKKVPPSITGRMAEKYIEENLTVRDLADVSLGKMKIEYDDLEFEKVKIKKLD